MVSYKLVMPGDMNNYNFLFGGKMLMWVDEFAWIAVSTDFPNCRFVTRSLGEISFFRKVEKGSILKFESKRVKIGNTSVTYHVDVYAQAPSQEDNPLVFHTDIVFVCVDEQGEKCPIPREP